MRHTSPLLALWPALLTAAVVALAYLPTLANELVWDDRIDILANGATRDIGNALAAFTRLQGAYYRPLVLLSFAVERRLWGDAAFGFHLSNLILHACNVFLLIGAARGGGVALPTAVFAGLVFGLHPLQTDAVAYVSGRTDVLMTSGALLAWRALQSRASLAARAAMAAGAVAVAILSKDAGYAAIPCAAWWAYRHERDWNARVGLVGPAALVGLLLALTRPGGMPLPGGTLVVTGVSAVGQALWTYVTLLLWPHRLHIDRFTTLSDAASIMVAASALVVLVGVTAAWALRRRTAVADWAFWAVAFYLPVANVIALYPAVADHWLFTPEHNLYAPLAGIAVLVATVIARMDEKLRHRWRWALRCVAAAMLVASAATTIVRLGDWRDESRLFGRAVEAGAVSPRVWFNHANTLVRLGRLNDGIAAYRTTLERAPHDVDAWTNLGVALQRSGAVEAALAAYTHAATLAPPSALLLENLGTAQLRRGDLAAARASFERALALDPNRQTARKAMAAIEQER